MKPNKKYTEEELVSHLLSGNATQFEIIYDYFSPSLFGVIKKIVKHDELAEDILQDGFMKIWNKSKFYEAQKSRLFTWMLNIMRNTAIDYLRSKHGKIEKKSLSFDSNLLIETPGLLIESNYENIGLKKIVSELKVDQLEIINLAFFEGYTQDEISKKLQIPLGTVKTKYRNALITLRKRLITTG
ncbi:MAG: sigma-70 family RNA polymerase sigma factor [Bacteroidota bacterium]|nr:sigma-70 family RNA polymerase sigma factor [Bacteroidota bacterium]MDP3143783.1 sigma-70 family RNA polymerase sigma factor [Bacteroidota bacterium]